MEAKLSVLLHSPLRQYPERDVEDQGRQEERGGYEEHDAGEGDQQSGLGHVHHLEDTEMSMML